MSEEFVQLLLVEANAADAERLQALLSAMPDLPAETRVVADVAAAEVALRENLPSLLLLSLETARAGAVEEVVALRRRYAWLPILIIASDRDAAAAAALVSHGAQDCLGQDDLLPDLLARAIRHALARHRADAALRANEEFFRLICDNVTDLVAVIDRHGRRIYNSPSYERTLGRAGAPPGSDSFAQIHPEDRTAIQTIFQETLETGSGKPAAYRLVLPSGAVKHIESVGSAIRDHRGQVDRVVIVARDITERRQMLEGLEHALTQLRDSHAQLQKTRARLLEAEKREVMSTFAGAIAHEVKNPLQTILLGLDYFKSGVAAEDTATVTVLSEMEQATRKADAVVRGLLEFAAYGENDVSEQRLDLLVEEALAIVRPEAEARRVQLEHEHPPELPRLRLDPKKIKHVCLRLLFATVQAMRSGDTLRILTGVRGVGNLPSLGTALPGGSRVVMELIDEGPGLATALPAATAEAGKGELSKFAFDLMVVRKVVETFGGKVEFTKREKGGARISLLFKA